MTTVVEQLRGTPALRAPASGVLRWMAPRALCGELELFEAGDAVAMIGDAPVFAPERGFIVRRLVAEGRSIEEGQEIATFGVA